MIKIMLADDHEIVLDGLTSLIKPVDGIEIIGKVLNGKDVIPLMNEIDLDVIVLDINIPGINGVELTGIIKSKFPNVKILILTMHDEIGFIRRVIEAGADGYILKNKGKEELITGIKEVFDGKEYFGDDVKKALVSSYRTKKTFGEVRLTKREKEVLCLIADGKTTPLIAEKLHIADSTVETHRRNLIDKTGTKNTKGLVRYAIENGFY